MAITFRQAERHLLTLRFFLALYLSDFVHFLFLFTSSSFCFSFPSSVCQPSSLEKLCGVFGYFFFPHCSEVLSRIGFIKFIPVKCSLKSCTIKKKKDLFKRKNDGGNLMQFCSLNSNSSLRSAFTEWQHRAQFVELSSEQWRERC